MERWIRRIRNGSFVVLVALVLGSSSTIVRAYDTCNGPNWAGLDVFTYTECFWWSQVSYEDACNDMLASCNGLCQSNYYAYGTQLSGCEVDTSGPYTYLANYACECHPY